MGRDPPKSPQRPRRGKTDDARRARLYLTELSWLAGAPEAGRWRRFDTDELLALDGVRISKARRAARTVLREHPAALRELVGDVERWWTIVDAKLAWCSAGGAFDPVPYLPNRIGKLVRGKVARELAIAWLEGPELVERGLSWLAANASALAGLDDRVVNVLARLVVLGDRKGKEAREAGVAALIAALSIDSPDPAYALDRTRNAEAALLDQSHTPATDPGRTRPTLLAWIGKLVRRDSTARQCALALIAQVGLAETFAPWVTWESDTERVLVRAHELARHQFDNWDRSRHVTPLLTNLINARKRAPEPVSLRDVLLEIDMLASEPMARFQPAIVRLLRACGDPRVGVPVHGRANLLLHVARAAASSEDVHPEWLWDALAAALERGAPREILGPWLPVLAKTGRHWLEYDMVEHAKRRADVDRFVEVLATFARHHAPTDDEAEEAATWLAAGVADSAVIVDVIRRLADVKTRLDTELARAVVALSDNTASDIAALARSLLELSENERYHVTRTAVAFVEHAARSGAGWIVRGALASHRGLLVEAGAIAASLPRSKWPPLFGGAPGAASDQQLRAARATAAKTLRGNREAVDRPAAGDSGDRRTGRESRDRSAGRGAATVRDAGREGREAAADPTRRASSGREVAADRMPRGAATVRDADRAGSAGREGRGTQAVTVRDASSDRAGLAGREDRAAADRTSPGAVRDDVVGARDPLPRWVDRYPAALHAVLRLLVSVDPDAERTAAKKLATDFPDPADLEREIAVLRSSGKAPKRLATLEHRLANPSVPSAKRLANLAAKLESAACEIALARFVATVSAQVGERFVRAFNLPSWEAWAATIADVAGKPGSADAARLREILCGLLDLPEAADRELAGRLLRARCGPPPWDLRDLPANRKFLDRMRAAKLDPEPWLDDRAHVVTANDGKPVSLAFAADPLDIFAMGWHFETCLSPRGGNFFSVVANAADINKRVLYARRDGRVLGRCLFALTDGLALIAFHQYSHDGALDFSSLVRDFATDLAARIGTQVAPRGPVRTLLARDWYDDGARDIVGRFANVDDEFDIRRIPPEELVPRLRELLGRDLDEVSLPVIVNHPSLRLQPRHLAPLVPFILASQSSQLHLEAARLALDNDDLELADRLLGDHDHVIDLEHHGYYWGSVLAKLRPSITLARLRRTRSRHVRSWANEGGDRVALAGIALEMLQRPRQAAAMYRLALVKEEHWFGDELRERLRKLGEPLEGELAT